MTNIETISSRIKFLRNDLLKISQKTFGERLNMGDTIISKYEKSQRDIGDRVITAICLEFNVNEDWLRYGTGEVFKQQSTEYLDLLIEKFGLDEDDRYIIEQYIKFDDEDRDVMKIMLRKLLTPRSVMKTHVDEVNEQLKDLDQYDFEDLTEEPEEDESIG